MGTRLVSLLRFVSAGVLAAADSKGSCPPTPAKPKVVATKASAPQTPPTPDAQYAGTVMLMAVISDKGYECDAQVIHGLDKETDKKAAGAVRQRHFQPARKDGHTVPVVVAVEVNYWRKTASLFSFPQLQSSRRRKTNRNIKGSSSYVLSAPSRPAENRASTRKALLFPQHKLIRKKACAEKASTSWMCSAMSTQSSDFRKSIRCVRCVPRPMKRYSS
jgi:hypothetical protein